MWGWGRRLLGARKGYIPWREDTFGKRGPGSRRKSSHLPPSVNRSREKFYSTVPTAASTTLMLSKTLKAWNLKASIRPSKRQLLKALV